ncbi:MAG: type II secretion system F family protein [Alphaproteobacteria bacterium]|nr:type II secretion system F family protein [Alphaproteobacteria bacterium]
MEQLLSTLLPSSVGADDFYVLLSGGVAFFCVWAILVSFSNADRFSKQIKHIHARREDLREQFVEAKQRKKHDVHVSLMRAIAMKLQLVKKNQIGKTQAVLVQAGFRSPDAIYVLAFFNVLMPILLFVAGIVVMQMNSDVAPKWRMMNYIWPVLGAYMGLKLPWVVVRRSKKKRNARIQKSLPDVLDLMTICAEAGLSLVAMLDRVSRELKLVYPEMAEELSLTSIEIGFLPDRSKALLNLSERCDLPEIRGMVSVLIQTEKYGTPISQALRVLSAEFRQARMLRAEQKAGRLPALMTVPMIVFILPTLFIVIIAPAVVKLMNM